LSQTRNPRADPTDVALLVAYDGDTVVGNLGILPDTTFVDGQGHKIGWLTAWWANPDRRYAGVGLMLLMRALKIYGGALGASGFSDDAKRVYSATRKFSTIRDIEGITLFARFNSHDLLPRRHPWLSRLGFVLQAVDYAANQCLRVIQWLWQHLSRMPEGFRLEYLAEMDPEAQEFIERHQIHELTKRGIRELNWITKNSWILNAPLAPPSSFPFSSTAKTAMSFNMKIYDAKDRIAAVLILVVVDGHLTVPYCYHDDCAPQIAHLICDHVIALGLERVTTYRAELIRSLDELRFPWVWSLKKTRAWILSTTLGDHDLSGYTMQDGDGDCAFAP
jgi:hypothetical protein